VEVAALADACVRAAAVTGDSSWPALMIASASATTRSRVSARRRLSSLSGGVNHSGRVPGVVRGCLPLAGHGRVPSGRA
jgi:hypothetical protein